MPRYVTTGSTPARSPSPVRLRRHRQGLHQPRCHRFRSVCRRQGLGTYSAAVGLINRSSARVCQVRHEHAPTTARASGCRCVAPSGRSIAAFGPRCRLPTCLLRHVRCWWFSCCCTNSRPAAAPSHRAVASLHTVIVVTSRGHRWLPPCHLPRHGLSPSAHGLLQPRCPIGP
jgi:hypothetical protein